MHQAKDIKPVKSPDVKKEDQVSGFQKLEGLGSNHIVHVHVDPIISNSLSSSSSYCKAHQNHSDSHDVKVDIDHTEATDDRDSRLQDSSLKASSSLKSSVTFTDNIYDDNEEVRPGFFDYMPSQSVHTRIAQTFHTAYEEEVKLDFREGNLTVESPHVENCVSTDHEHRSQNCASTYLEHRSQLCASSDHEHHRRNCASSDHEHRVDESSHPYPRFKHTCWDYMPGGKHSEDEEMEDEEDERDCRQNSGTPSSFVPSTKRSSRKVVDECLSYNLMPLSDSTAGHEQQPNTAALHSLYQDQLFSKEKDQKNSRSKDDSDRSEVSGQVDINGNPRLLDPANYLPMRQWPREWPRGKSENAATASLSNYTPITIPHSHSSSSSDLNIFDRKKERRRMRLERRKGTLAEEYKDHKKFNDIKEILAFVEGSKKSSKADSKTTKRKQERGRKRDHPFNGPLLLEDLATGEDASSKESSLVVTPAQVAMGNSLRSVGHNGISKTGTEEEDADKAEFHDCFNTLPDELLTSEAGSDSEQQKWLVSSGQLVKTAHIFSDTADKSDSSSAGDSVTDIQIINSNKTGTKKQTKTKNKKEKAETISGSNGPSSLKSKMMKPNDLEMKDSLLVISVPDYENNKTHSTINKEFILEVKREDSFTEVKKKKKRPGGKDSSTAPTNQVFSISNHFHINNSRHHHSSRHHAHTPGPPQAGSSTAAVSYNHISLPTSHQSTFSRDLSPSAFPVLSGQGAPGTLRAEARTNSCGDLTSESADSKTYDSDRESAKSLPEAHGSGACRDISLVYLVSYARIAAAPPKDSTNSEASASSVSGSLTHSQANNVSPQSSINPAVTPERKATVWKGSPRERRHSIGSGPEDKPETDKSSVAERNRQCGSQEVLNRGIVASAPAASQDVPVSASLQATLTKTCEESSSLLSQTGTQEQIIASVAKLSYNQMVKTSSTSTFTKSLPLKNQQKYLTGVVVSTEHAATSISNSSQMDPNTTVTIGSNMPTQSSQPLNTAPSGTPGKEANLNKRVKKDSSVQSVIQSVTASLESTKTVSSKNSLTPGPDVARKHNSSKSVIFLDKRFDSISHQNLGITFGFDSSCESTREQTSQQPQPLLPSHHEFHPVMPSSLSNDSSRDPPVQLPHPAVSQDPSYIPPATVPHSQPTAGSLTKPSDNNSIVPKTLHINGSRNGMLFSSNSAKIISKSQVQFDGKNISNIICNSCSNGSSVSANNSDINLSSRTKPSEAKLEIPVSHDGLNYITNNDLSAKSGISNLSFIACNSPVQAAVAIPHVVTKNSSTETTSTDDLQPPLSETPTTEIGDKNVSSTLSLPSDQTKKESTSQCQNVSVSLESTLGEPDCNPPSEAKDVPENPVTNIPALTASARIASQPHHQILVPSETLPLAKPVVYGLMIKPGVGCGKLFFVPSVFKKNKGNSTEICAFLRKKWQHDVIQKKDSETFVNLKED